eukprot:gene9895-10421_t
MLTMTFFEDVIVVDLLVDFIALDVLVGDDDLLVDIVVVRVAVGGYTAVCIFVVLVLFWFDDHVPFSLDSGRRCTLSV